MDVAKITVALRLCIAVLAGFLVIQQHDLASSNARLVQLLEAQQARLDTMTDRQPMPMEGAVVAAADTSQIRIDIAAVVRQVLREQKAAAVPAGAQPEQPVTPES